MAIAEIARWGGVWGLGNGGSSRVGEVRRSGSLFLEASVEIRLRSERLIGLREEEPFDARPAGAYSGHHSDSLYRSLQEENGLP